MKQIVLDTETTGLSPAHGHRVIELACVELHGRRISETWFHHYLNPERSIEDAAKRVHGLSEEALRECPVFAEVAEQFLCFVEGAELLIHNAKFDVGFLNEELSLAGAREQDLSRICKITDTVALAQRKSPGQRASLDALCKRYGIDNSHRALHGAKLDVDLLARVYLRMIGGQASLLGEDPSAAERALAAPAPPRPLSPGEARVASRLLRCSEAEREAHERYLDMLDARLGSPCVWRRSPAPGQAGQAADAEPR